MAVVTWSPELRMEVKRVKLFSSINSESLNNYTKLSASEQNAMNNVFSVKQGETKDLNYGYWV